MKLAAVIIETRMIPNLVGHIKDHVKFLPSDVDVIWYGNYDISPLAVEAFKNELAPFCKLVKYESMMTKVDVVKYNHILSSQNFWRELLEYDRVLIFQHDSALLKEGVEEFYDWDYVGAPWRFQAHGGNGGLSIRNPKTMLKISVNFPWSSNQGNEDVWFCNIMHNHKIGKLAPLCVAEKFSCESIFRLGTLGYHAVDKWLSPAECEQIKTQYK